VTFVTSLASRPFAPYSSPFYTTVRGPLERPSRPLSPGGGRTGPGGRQRPGAGLGAGHLRGARMGVGCRARTSIQRMSRPARREGTAKFVGHEGRRGPSRLLKKAHLRRWRARAALRRTAQVRLAPRLARRIASGSFEQPAEKRVIQQPARVATSARCPVRGRVLRRHPTRCGTEGFSSTTADLRRMARDLQRSLNDARADAVGRAPISGPMAGKPRQLSARLGPFPPA
jgi:hypothetical protein